MMSSPDTSTQLASCGHCALLCGLDHGSSARQIAVQFLHPCVEQLLGWPTPVNALIRQQRANIAEPFVDHAQLLGSKLECDLSRGIHGNCHLSPSDDPTLVNFLPLLRRPGAIGKTNPCACSVEE